MCYFLIQDFNLQTLDENLADNKIVEVTKKLSLDNLQQDANQSKLDNWLKKASQNKGLQKVDQNKVLQKVDQNKENRKAWFQCKHVFINKAFQRVDTLYQT